MAVCNSRSLSIRPVASACLLESQRSHLGMQASRTAGLALRQLAMVYPPFPHLVSYDSHRHSAIDGNRFTGHEVVDHEHGDGIRHIFRPAFPP